MSAEIVVLVEHTNGVVKKVSFELLTLAARHGSPSAVIIGAGADQAVADVVRYGAAKVYVANDAALTTSVVGPKVAILNQLVASASPAAVLIPSTAEGKEIAGRLAVRSGSGVITDAVDIEDGIVAVQSVFGGSTMAPSYPPSMPPFSKSGIKYPFSMHFFATKLVNLIPCPRNTRKFTGTEHKFAISIYSVRTSIFRIK